MIRTKERTIQIRVDAETKARWQAAAERDERTLSDWIRRVLNAKDGLPHA